MPKVKHDRKPAARKAAKLKAPTRETMPKGESLTRIVDFMAGADNDALAMLAYAAEAIENHYDSPIAPIDDMVWHLLFCRLHKGAAMNVDDVARIYEDFRDAVDIVAHNAEVAAGIGARAGWRGEVIEAPGEAA